MATTKKRSSNRRKYIVLSSLAVLVLLLAGSALALHVRHDHKNKATAKASASHSVNAVNYSPSTPNETQANDGRKSSTSPSNTLNDQSTPPTNTAPTVTILNASVANGNLHVGTLVNGATSGTCTLTASKDSQQITLSTAAIQRDVNSYDCGVFNVATTQFPTSGTWQLTLAISANGQQATASTNVTVAEGS